MKLRLTGTDQECADAVAALAAGFVLREVSGFYPVCDTDTDLDAGVEGGDGAGVAA
jgi:hypothetical protein